MANDVTAPVTGGKFATLEIAEVHHPKGVMTDFAGVDVLGLVIDEPAPRTLLGRFKGLTDAIVARLPTLGGKAASGSLSVTPSTSGFEVSSATLLAKLTEVHAAAAETLARQKATYVLGANVQIAANAGGAPIANVYSGSYIWTAVTSAASVALQVLGPDGTTWQTVETIAAGGGPKGVVLPEGASIRLFNPTGAAATVSGKLG